MRKSTVVRTWIVGLVLLAFGMIVTAVSIGLMLGYGGTFTARGAGAGYNFVPNFDSFFWTTVAAVIGGLIVSTAGGLVQLAAWIGSLVNTYRLPDRAWFAILLVSGIVSLFVPIIGFAGMLAYIVGGPDGSAPTSTRAPGATPMPTRLTPVA
jgi:hypothetical protein